MEIKVSVILPSLNVKDYIEEAVRSVMEQTLKEIEILCIDAGSEDGTWEILSRLAETDDRIVLCHSDVKSYGYQVNMGIDMANGRYIAILETDDYADVSMYERLYEQAVLKDCDYVKSDYYLYRTEKNGKRTFLRRYSFQTEDLYDKIIKPVKYAAVAVGDWYLWNGLYKKQFLMENNIRLSETPRAAYQDIGFILQTTIFATKALYLKEAHYRYCTDREGASANSGKGLQYAYQEFSAFYYLTENAEEDVIRAFYCRMAKSFIYCFDDMQEESGIDSEKRSKYYMWFQQRLNDACIRNRIDRSIFQTDIWKKLEDLLISETYYLEKCKAHIQKMQEVLGEPGKSPVLIFGCGHYGYEAYKWLQKHAYHAAAFMDNNRLLWGTNVQDLPVLSPEQGRVRYPAAKYLIANEMHAGAMKRQLLEMGVSDGDICVYV